MQAYWSPLLAAALVFAVFSIAAALWQRRRARRLASRLTEAEHSRLDAEDELRQLRRRAGAEAPAAPLHDQDERRAVLERALTPPPVGAEPWPDTEPMPMTTERQPFAPTQPMPEYPPH